MADEPSTPPAGKSRLRSPAYPLFDLGEAIAKARLLWDSQRKSDGHLDSVLHALNYTTRHGQALRAVAALNHYGLTEEVGSKDNRRIRLTDLAQDILHLPEDDRRRAESLQVAALSPTIHQVLWERYQTQLPGDPALKGFLVRDRNFNESAAEDVISNYRASFALAKLGSLMNSKPPETAAGAANGGKTNYEKPPERKAVAPSSSQTPTVHISPAPAAPQAPMTQELPILVDHGQVAKIPFPMSEDAFDLLIGTLNLWKKRLVSSPVAAPAAVSSAAQIIRFPVPLAGIWKNKDHDRPVQIVALMKSPGLPDHFQTAEGTGLPATEVHFPGTYSKDDDEGLGHLP